MGGNGGLQVQVGGLPAVGVYNNAMSSEPSNAPVAPKFGQRGDEYEAPRPRPGVREAMKGDIEASVFCTADHGDGRKRWRVAVLTKTPRRLVTDTENVSWPDTGANYVLASCLECWRVLCDVCLAEGEEGYCTHTSRGDWSIDVAKLKEALGKSQKDIDLADLLWTSLAEESPSA